MNFMRYTFTPRFFVYVVGAFGITLIMAGLLAAMRLTTGVIISFSALILFLLVSVIVRYRSWKRYTGFQKISEDVSRQLKIRAYADRKN